jgi:nucleotide-binding universal stress UspA family protein
MSGTWRVLLPTDGSPPAERALRHVLALSGRGLPVELHLLNAQPPLPGAAASVLPDQTLSDFHREEAMRVLADPIAVARSAGVEPIVHIGVGDPGDLTLVFAKRLAVDQIVMGTRGFSLVASLLLGSAARRVVGESDGPVTLLR